MTNIAIVLIVVSVIGLAGLLLYYYLLKKKYSKSTILYAKDTLVVKNKVSLKETFDKLYQVLYLTFVKMPLLKYYAKKIRLKYEMSNDYTEYELRRNTGRLLSITLVVMFVTLAVFVNVVNDLYMTLIILVGIIIVAEKVIDITITSVSNKILRQMPEAFTTLRHAFHEHGMVDEALSDTIDEMSEKEIAPQLKRIREAIISDQPEVELERYYDTAPNRFLKLFAGISFLTFELGDRKVADTSIYLKNLNNILNEIYLEILKQDKLKSTFRSLTIIAVVPLIFIKPLESWATGSFAALSNFYNSSIGFVMETLIIVSIFMSYLLLRVLRDDGEEIKFDRVSKIKWQDKLYKIDFIRIIVDAFKTKSHTAKYKKEVNLIKDTNSYLTIEWLYVNKFAYAFVGFVLTILLILNMNLITKNSAYTKLGNEFLSLGKLSEEDQAAADEIADFDLDYIEEYKNKGVTKEELAEKLTDKSTGTVDNEAVDRIYDKINTVNNSYLKFWHVIIAMIVGAIAYYIPNISLYMKNSVRKMDKENEIMQFQSIILMLMHIDRVDVQTVLEWLCRFSYAFREPIATCLNNYEAGAEQALEELKDSVPNKDFQRIVEQLESAVTRIPVKAAFDELETERAFFYEKRKDANENLVKRKASIGQVLGFTPMVLLIAGYLVAPLLIVSILQMLNYFGQMTF
ncbi:MAG: hypothetical protein IJX34_01600 [Clostridia bacterium]|nr:hypothetical protein [Clostridia bacterium]